MRERKGGKRSLFVTVESLGRVASGRLAIFSSKGGELKVEKKEKERRGAKRGGLSFLFRLGEERFLANCLFSFFVWE